MTLAHTKVSSKVTCNKRAPHEQIDFQVAFLSRLATRESVKDHLRLLTQLFIFIIDKNIFEI
jgi:hypothetical protein